MDYSPNPTPAPEPRPWLPTVVALVFTFVSGVAIGRSPNSTLSGAIGSSSSTVSHLYTVNQKDGVDFNEFWQVWDTVKQKYVHQPVTDRELFYGAMQGMVQGLNDPYSVYFPPKDAGDFKQDLSGQFEGIGAEIGMKEKQIVVIAPLPDSPAEKAGVKSGDIIVRIDGKDTAGLALDEAVNLIRGAHGTSVTLTLAHAADKKLIDITVKRQVITVPTVRLETKPGNIAYIRINFFNQDTSKDFDDIVQKVVAQKSKGVILDLRSNPGGYLESAVDVASEWIATGPIVKERDSTDHEVVHDARGMHRLVGMPTVVLVDGGSASASEIVAGALQDKQAAKLVGQKTFGKGSVQDFLDLPDGSALKITIAKWLTPENREINEKGILPDMIVDPMFDPKAASSTPTDFGVKKALEMLTTHL